MTACAGRGEGAFYPAKSLKSSASRRRPQRRRRVDARRREATASRKWPDKGTLLERQMRGCDSEKVRRVAIAKFLASNARAGIHSLARAKSSERQLGETPIFSTMLAF